MRVARPWRVRYPGYLSIDLPAEEGKKEPTFRSAQAWRLSTYGLAHSPFVPLTTTSTCCSRRHYARSCGLQVAGRHPVVFYYDGRPCIKLGGGRFSTLHCVRFHMAGGERLSTLPFFRLYIDYQKGGAALYHPLCSVLYSSGVEVE